MREIEESAYQTWWIRSMDMRLRQTLTTLLRSPWCDSETACADMGGMSILGLLLILLWREFIGSRGSKMKYRRPKELHDFLMNIRQETDRAIQVEYDGETYWLPKSQIEYNPTPDGKMYEVTIPDWLVEEKGLK
jgi:hypothetical protein